MTNQILINKIKKSCLDVDKLLKKGFDINNSYINLIEDILKINLPVLSNYEKINNISDLTQLERSAKEIYDNINKIKNEVEINEFYINNKHFDLDKLKYEFLNNKKLKKKFPKFNIKLFMEYLKNPLLEIANYEGEIIEYDLFYAKKIMTAIIQMIFNEMDLYILNIGKEGSGKSCWSSQQILYLYTILKNVGLIDYNYDEKKLFFTDIVSFLEEHQKQKKNDYFRIECLDEGNELSRVNFHDENIKQFKYEMRTERKLLRIIIINMQQLGELDTAISLSRVNFIFNCNMQGNKKTGTLNKGFTDMYIIPRDEIIYSERYRKNFTREDILNIFAKKLEKKKDYYVSMPKELIVKNFKFKNIWGFDKEKYDDHVKDELTKRKFSKSMKITDLQAFILWEKLNMFGKLGLFDREKPNEKKMYDNLRAFFIKLEKYFESNPEKVISIRNMFSLK